MTYTPMPTSCSTKHAHTIKSTDHRAETTSVCHLGQAWLHMLLCKLPSRIAAQLPQDYVAIPTESTAVEYISTNA